MKKSIKQHLESITAENLEDFRHDAFISMASFIGKNGNYSLGVNGKGMYVVKNHIETNGLPFFISFDHDLADSHYTPEPLWTDYDKSKEWQEKQVHKEKTGYECALWLIDYCIDNNLKLPKYFCHSMNPVGKDKIISVLNSFQKQSTT